MEVFVVFLDEQFRLAGDAFDRSRRSLAEKEQGMADKRR
jgi:hypothetical protein